MSFESFFDAQSVLLWTAFGLAFVLGAVANKTNFCTMGAVSDMVNIGDFGRFRAWLLAIAVALIGVVVLESYSVVNVAESFPPYRSSQLIWAENLLGGLMFGVGMTLTSGCGNKCLVRFGAGNLKSIFVILVIGVTAYFMLNPFPGSDKTLFSVVFYDWIRPTAISLPYGQDLGSLVAGEAAGEARAFIGGALGILLLWFIFKSAEFRASVDNIMGGLVVGLVVLGAWYVTSSIQIDTDIGQLSLSEYYDQWDMLADSEAGMPAQGRPLGTQSFTFISPMGQAVSYMAQGFRSTLLTFGVLAFVGVFSGSLVWSLLSRSFRIEWFSSIGDFARHIIGAVLMGVGGVLALGCTIGQAITGISTLAAGSFITFFAIVFSCILTMKIQYYKMVYDEEVGFVSALVASLADLHLLPNRLRKLDKV